jgi:hypothetical protein
MKYVQCYCDTYEFKLSLLDEGEDEDRFIMFDNGVDCGGTYIIAALPTLIKIEKIAIMFIDDTLHVLTLEFGDDHVVEIGSRQDLELELNRFFAINRNHG